LSHSPFTVLEPYGWTAARAAQLPAGTHPSRVVRYDGASMLAVTPDGLRALRAVPWLDPPPTVGDWLAVRGAPDGDPHDIQVERVLERTSLLRRMTADGSGSQALAANVDIVLITCGLDRPVRAGRIHRAAAQAWDADAHPVLLLTKAGAPGAAEVDLPRLELEHPGMHVLVTSSQEGIGLDDLRALVAGRTAVLVGESGAGKSTLINALLGRDAIATGAVREGDAKGRHTTTSRQLHVLPGPGGGVVIDTPGIRSLGLFASSGSVDAAFADIQELAAECRFSDCRHDTEPGCAVLGARDSGELGQGRYDSWRRLQKEVASAAMRSSPHELRKHGRRFGRAAREGAALKQRSGEGRWS
jgi:ribosome biogenesis GTPase / thiamine phosphate phosphatase